MLVRRGICSAPLAAESRRTAKPCPYSPLHPGTEPLAATPSDRDWELRVHRISGDGRCLFRAIAHSDALASRRGQGPTLTVAEVRPGTRAATP